MGEVTMDAVVEFVNRFVEAEFNALMAGYTEPDDLVVLEREQAALKYFHVTRQHMMSLEFTRPPGLFKEELEEMAAESAGLTQRAVFLIQQHRHPEHGDLFQVITSRPKKSLVGSYGAMFYVTSLDGELKIISKYAPGLMAEEDRLSWDHLQGTRIAQPGDPVDLRRLKEPTMPAHKAHYEKAGEK